MIYLDSSVALAHLFGETRVPPAALWDDALISSRLLEYEIWTRVHAEKLAREHEDKVRRVIERVSLLELSPVVLARALEPFPTRVRTLDALHLASMEYLRARGEAIVLASYDERLTGAARQLGIELYESSPP